MKIPFISTPDKPLIASTQDKVPVADIVDNLIIYKSGGAALVLESTSLNFGLLSTIEQEAVIAAYAALLNSFTFPVQITVRSQRKDISNYIKFLGEAENKIKNPKLAVIMRDYKSFRDVFSDNCNSLINIVNGVRREVSLRDYSYGFCS